MTSSIPVKNIPKGTEVQVIKQYFDRMRVLLPVPTAVTDTANSSLTAPSPFQGISSTAKNQKSIEGRVSQTHVDHGKRSCICNDVSRNNNSSTQTAGHKENGEPSPQKGESDIPESYLIAETLQQASNSTQRVFADLKLGRQKALARLLEKHMIESCLDFDAQQSVFHDLDKWLHITGFYDSKHRESVLRLYEAMEALEKQVHAFEHENNIEHGIVTGDSPSQELRPKGTSTSDNCFSPKHKPDNGSSEQARKREASQDLLRESCKIPKSENHRSEMLVIWYLFGYRSLRHVPGPNIMLEITGSQILKDDCLGRRLTPISDIMMDVYVMRHLYIVNGEPVHHHILQFQGKLLTRVSQEDPVRLVFLRYTQNGYSLYL